MDLESTLKESGDQLLYTSINIADGSGAPIDTLNRSSITATITYPVKTVVSAGVGQENKWFIGGEYTFQKPLEFSGGVYDEIDFYTYGDYSSASFGGFYIPKMNSFNYFERVTYRAGVNYKKTGLIINDTEINQYGISFGVSLPMGLKLSNVNLGFEMGKRGTTDNNLIEENFYNFRLSLSLNDKWFRKQKIY